MTSNDTASVSKLLAGARSALQASSLTADLDARILLEFCLDIPRVKLLADPALRVSGEQALRFQSLVLRRAAGEPISHLIGKREFFGRDFIVTPQVLDPRPETELLIEISCRLCAALQKANLSLLDLGTGSGCIAITMALELERIGKFAQIVAVDVSSQALEVAKQNAQRWGVEIDFRESNWFQAILPSERFDLIVSNPPYISEGDTDVSPETRFEPRQALYAGASGLDAIHTLLSQAADYLTPAGKLLIETGAGQHAAISLRASQLKKWGKVESLRDLSGLDRAVLLSQSL